MALTSIPLTDLTEDHFRRLIEAQTAESLHVEYKRQTYGGADDQRREFLADVSSFANAAGGDLVVSIVEKQGIPADVNPFTGDADGERLRLEQMARDGINPRITNLQTRAVPVSVPFPAFAFGAPAISLDHVEREARQFPPIGGTARAG